MNAWLKIVIPCAAVVAALVLFIMWYPSQGSTTTVGPQMCSIYIEGDHQFTPANGVSGGSGTPDDPYIIENKTISAAAHGIHIKNTTRHFVIRNCVVENCGEEYHGIYLSSVANGRVENCTVRNGRSGICLCLSENIHIAGTIAENGAEAGIYIVYSKDVYIENTVAAANRNHGIYLGSRTRHCTVRGCVIENNSGAGIFLMNYTSDHAVIGCRILGNGTDILSIKASGNTFDGVVYGTSQGIPSVSNISVDASGGAVTISWWTDVDTAGRVDYWITPENCFTVYSGPATHHVVRLDNLAPGTYRFRIAASDPAYRNTVITVEDVFVCGKGAPI